MKLFKTEKRGWGIRCLDDIPQGQFICAYTGEILTEQEANSEGKKFCDEYLADLNHIETKEGYESDVTDIEEMSSESQASSSGMNLLSRLFALYFLGIKSFFG